MPRLGIFSRLLAMFCWMVAVLGPTEVHGLQLPILEAQSHVLDFDPALACRVGEASHPGPDEVAWFGTSNPSGLRGKESLLAELGCGVWCLSETQLSAENQRSVGKTLRHC